MRLLLPEDSRLKLLRLVHLVLATLTVSALRTDVWSRYKLGEIDTSIAVIRMLSAPCSWKHRMTL